MPSDTDRILAEVDRAAGEIVDFATRLIRIPTVNPPGEEYEHCATVIGDQLRAHGLDVQLLPAIGKAEHTLQHPRINVIGRHAGRRVVVPSTSVRNSSSVRSRLAPMNPLAPSTRMRTLRPPGRERADAATDPQSADGRGQAPGDAGRDRRRHRPPIPPVKVLAVENPHGLVDGPGLSR